MLNRCLIPFYVCLFLLSGTRINAQASKALFRSDSIVNVIIEMPLKEVLKDRKERNRRDGKISYTTLGGEVVELDIKVKVRGNTRTLNQICTFPPLELRFNKSQTKNTLFEDQKKIKLVTHCRSEDSYEKYVQKEYLIYKMYQIVTPYSFSVRPFQITYIDTEKQRKPYDHFSFMIEDIKDVAQRNGLNEFKDSIRIQEVINKESLDKLMVFQYMIGNHDWSIPLRHNMKLIKGDKGDLPIAVPYDFDYSGLVDTPYALPPEEAHLESVRERDFRGFCRQNGYGETIDFYKSIQGQLFDEIHNADFLSESNQNSMIQYLNGFFNKIDDPKYVDRNINRACRVKHKHKYM